jgi:hypothetical protein
MPMNSVHTLLNAYYEALYGLLEARKPALSARILALLEEEISRLQVPGLSAEQHAAYRETCLAFLDERIETYNPFGIHYTFDNLKSREAVELEMQLSWYDQAAEFDSLIETIRRKTKEESADDQLGELAAEVIREVGAFPDASIRSAYEAQPALYKMPDYVVACAIEEMIR